MFKYKLFVSDGNYGIYCICILPRGGMHWEIHPDSRQCTAILSALAGKYLFCGVTTDGASIS